MRRRLLANLHLMILLLALLGWGLLSVGPSPQWAAAGEPEAMLAWDHDRVEEGADSDTGVPHNLAQQLIARPMYTTATLLLEDLGGATTPLLTPYTTVPNTLENTFHFFTILKEGDTYYLWIAAGQRTGTMANVTSIEQRFESQDGLVWRNRSNTNLTWNNDAYKSVRGLRHVTKNGSIYEGWEQYFYEWSAGWGTALRHQHRWSELDGGQSTGAGGRFFCQCSQGGEYLPHVGRPEL
jgi:hypothetical protein